MVVAFLLDAVANDVWNTVGCLLAVPLLIGCFRFYHHTLRRETAECTGVAETGEILGADQQVAEEEAASAVAGLDADNDFAFDYYDEQYDEDEEDDIQEVVEITFDLGCLEGNFYRIFSRMHRAVI